MASLSELETKRAQLIAEINQLTEQEQAVFREQRQVNAQLRSIKTQLQDPTVSAEQKDQLAEQGRELEAQYDRLEFQGVRLGEQRARLQQQVAEIDLQIGQLKQQQTQPVNSAGSIVRNADQANDDNAEVVRPGENNLIVGANGRVVNQAAVTTPSNASEASTESDRGTNAPVKTARSVQATPASTSASPPPPNQSRTQAPNAPGVAAVGDDNSRGVVSRINTIFGGQQARIVPQENVLSRYNNYTYNISIYIMDQADYAAFRAKPRSLPGSQLLMQSGGSPVGQRNQFFPLDFYIDDVRIRSLVSGRGTSGAHNAVSMEFRIFEPNGISLIANLVNATKRYIASRNQTADQQLNYAAQNYLMVIKFYGYDENGNLMTASGKVKNAEGAVESEAIVIKYIPFQFTGIKFRIANRVTEYECTAVAIRDAIGPSQTRGVIPYNIELSSTTLKELLKGNLTFASANTTTDTSGRERTGVEATPSNAVAGLADTGSPGPGSLFALEQGEREVITTLDLGTSVQASVQPAPPKADSAPKPNLVTGLAAALNQFQGGLVAGEDFLHPDVYDIKIDEAILANARIQPPEAAAGLQSLPMTSARSAAQKKLGSKQSLDVTAKNSSATAGMSVLQFIDLVVRTSTYIYDQQTKIFVQTKNNTWFAKPRGTAAQTFAWYRIGMEAVPYVYDEKRGDYAYKITYSVSPYQVNDAKSDYFPGTRFNGTHKVYKYWFTGENTEIIDYEQAYNYLYYLVVNGGQNLPKKLADWRLIDKKAFQPRSNESTQGAQGPINEPSSNAATVLYSPADTSRVKMTILGDPAWLQQGEIVTGIRGLDTFTYGPFLPDGSINYESREILFEVQFSQPVDYNLDTGLLKRTI